MTVIIDSALSDPMDLVGAALRKHGQADASGARRAVVQALSARNFEVAAKFLGSTEAVAKELFAGLVDKWGEPPVRP